MAFITGSFTVPLILIFLMASINDTLEDDGVCLKSLKNSLEVPHGKLNWRFDNATTGYICDFVGVTCWNLNENRVLSLELNDMELKGQFPRGLKYCGNLQKLDLGSNNLSGHIPSDICEMLPFLVSIDLSNNYLSGEIPADFAKCTYLNEIILSNNRLSGQIPKELGQLSRLKRFSVSNNLLSGPVADFFTRFDRQDFAGNKGLCGRPLKACKHRFRLFNLDPSFTDGLIVGYSFSATSVIVIYMSYCLPWTQLMMQRRKKKKSKRVKQGNDIFSSFTRKRKEKQKEANQIHELPTVELLEKGSEEIFLVLESFANRMSFLELSDATDCFSVDNAIGVGKMGMMYKATLPNDWFLAVKRLYNSQLFKRQFVLEIMILGRYKHRNMLPLLGFCIESMDRILVYQYMSNGRLSKWLHPLESEPIRLAWPVRVKIALGIARALSWLHHRLHIVHLSLYSECILLDQKFEPKISNFGEAKFLSHYGSDESAEQGLLKDVYDFGSVLFEMITGTRFNEMSYSSQNISLSSDPSYFYDAIDKSLIGKGFEDEIFTLIKIASDCVQPFLDRRPTMLQVYNYMSNICNGDRTSDDPIRSQRTEIYSDTSANKIVEL